MKLHIVAALAALALPLAACGGDGDDALADRAEDQAEVQADQAEAMGANDAVVDQIEEDGEDRADAIDDSDVDTDDLTKGQQDAMVNGN
ncbi:hypothetical protein [Sphingomonas japonica]|uniref:Small lipoprotein YifL n=1 Tax=Sphingomonas japonica TaxID=511662 RepID=A0ABX0U2M7_9SPHN|nr:hypothetical protein [Sphingomonas japonica]NIJ23577.1 putative small lipoprotein YifL [Sphingomonas japonica]